MHSVRHNQPSIPNEPAVAGLTDLRNLAPVRPVTVVEAMRVAELQAAQLLAACQVSDPPVSLDVVSSQRRIVLDYDFDMPDTISGTCLWDERARLWRITINGHKPETRQRFTVMHEYKHILDHGRPALRAPSRRRYYGLPPNEFIADYFAGCLLMPRHLLHRTWAADTRRVADLAVLFDVSQRAMEVRLAQLRLIPSRDTAPGRHGSLSGTEVAA